MSSQDIMLLLYPVMSKCRYPVSAYSTFSNKTETLDQHCYTYLTKYRFTPLLGSSILGF